MIAIGKHPPERFLHRLADGELDDEERSRTEKHVRICPQCRSRLAFLHELRDAARDIRHPAPPRELHDDILKSRAEGERVILPAAIAPTRIVRPLPALAAAAAVVLVAGVTLTLTSREAGAGASELRLSPAQPRPGVDLAVRYRPASLLAGEETLRLRVRYRTTVERSQDEPLAPLVEGELSRDGDTHRGALRLPGAAVYATFAVEDLAGERVDANGARLWSVMTHGDDGLPSLAALRQQYRDLEDRNWREATAVARRMVDLYPDRAEGWSTLLRHEMLILDSASLAGTREVHREKFQQLEMHALRAATLSEEDVAALVRYARLLDEEDSAVRLERLLRERHPSHPLAVQARVFEALALAGADPRARERALEEEWTRSGPVDAFLPEAGLRIGEEIGDAAVILKWADRVVRVSPGQADVVAANLTRVPRLRAEGIARLRAQLVQLGQVGDDERPLGLSRSEFREASAARARWLSARLGAALVADGRAEEALDVLRRAASAGWEPDVFRALADVALAAGDTTTAARYWGLVAVDPQTEPEWEVAIRERLGPGGERVWEDALLRGRDEMRHRILGGGPVPRPFPSGIPVSDLTGQKSDLVDRISGRTTLLTFGHRDSWPFLRDLPQLASAADRVQDRIRFVAVVDESASEEVRELFSRQAPGLDVLLDLDDSAADLLGVWSTPEYVVVDGSGRVWLRSIDLAKALRTAQALSFEETRAAS